MARKNIPKPSGTDSVAKIRRPKASTGAEKVSSIADVCKARNASTDPETFFGEPVEITSPEVEPEIIEQPLVHKAPTMEDDEEIEEQIEETVIEEIQIAEPVIEKSPESMTKQDLLNQLAPILHMWPKDIDVATTLPPVVPRARVVVKCNMYFYRGKKVYKGQSFVVEGEQNIVMYGNPDMFDVFRL